MLTLKVAAVTALLSASEALASPFAGYKVKSASDGLQASYDYVVVGAGAGGLTVANRLSENPSKEFSMPYITLALLTMVSRRERSRHRGW